MKGGSGRALCTSFKGEKAVRRKFVIRENQINISGFKSGQELGARLR